MLSSLRIAVTGLAGTYPFGGVFWDYIQYPLGLLRLGHDVLYIEDTGQWCYDPTAATFVENGAANAESLGRQIAATDPEMSDRWFYRDAAGNTFGKSWNEVVDFCRGADLFLHVSASCWMRDEYRAARRVVCIDSEPMFTQASVPAYLDNTIDKDGRTRVDRMLEHDVFFTFGENIGAPDCLIPTELFEWLPTRQPIVLDLFEPESVPIDSRRRVLTTVGSWESAEGTRIVNGVPYGGKGREFEKFIDLPKQSPLPLEVAMSGRAPVDRLRTHGWNMIDGYSVSRDPWVYRDYLARSFAEWSVAKHAYVASQSGWFSCRSACYLALGVPAIVQETGFSKIIPVGEGVLAFSTTDQAAHAVDQILTNPARHSAAARAIAQEYFDSDKVLGSLIDRAMTGVRPSALRAGPTSRRDQLSRRQAGA